MERITVGVVGAGVLGSHHARLYAQSSKAMLVGIYDSNRDTARRVARGLNTQAFSSISELVDRVDCLSVAVPVDKHYEIARSLFEQRKHILLEKPLAMTVQEGQELIDLAQKNRLVLQVGHVERYNPVMTYLEEKIKEPRFIEAHRLAPYPEDRPGLKPRGTEVNVVLDLMIHDIDVALYLAKSAVERIDAVGISVISDNEDIANVRLLFSNGCVANLTASRVSSEYVRRIRIFQTGLYLSLDYQHQQGHIYSLLDKKMHRESIPIKKYNALQKELDIFLDCIITARKSSTIPQTQTSAESALDALSVAERINQLIMR